MKLRRYYKIMALVLATLFLGSLLFVTLHSYPEPIVRRLNWLRCPGMYAIYIRQGTEELQPGSIQITVIGATLYSTTIQVSRWNNSQWEDLVTYSNVQIYSSTSFWVANDVRIGEIIYQLNSSQSSIISYIDYDWDETDTGEGYSNQNVIRVESFNSDGHRFFARYAVGSGLVTAWYQNGNFRLYQTNIFQIVDYIFSFYFYIIIASLFVVAFLIILGLTLEEGIRVYRQKK